IPVFRTKIRYRNLEPGVFERFFSSAKHPMNGTRELTRELRELAIHRRGKIVKPDFQLPFPHELIDIFLWYIELDCPPRLRQLFQDRVDTVGNVCFSSVIFSADDRQV